MISKHKIPIALAALVSFGLGIIIGPRLPFSKPAAKSSVNTPSSTNHHSFQIRGKSVEAQRAGISNAAPSERSSSLAETERAIRELLRSGRSQRSRLLNNVVESADPEQMGEVLAMVEKLPASYKKQLRFQLLTRWGSTNPAAALEFATALKDYSSRNEAIVSVLRGWSETDARAATAWAQQMPAGVV